VSLKNSDGHLEGRVTPLNMSGEEFAKIGHQLVDDVAALIDGVRDRPLGKGESPEVVRAALRAEASLPEGGTDAAALVKETTDLLIDHSLYNTHPRFFGYIQGPAAPVGILADLLASAVNPNLGGWILSPMASEIEDQATRWIAEFVGFPSGGDGVLTSGGNVANMLGFWAARAAKAPWDVRRGGMDGPKARPLRIYCARGTHTWVQKAADLSGLGSDSIRWIDTDDQDRMLIDELQACLEGDVLAGDCPLMIVGTGGSVSTGAVDQLPRIREICDRFDAWFHVDGAYGAFAAAASDVPEDLRGLALADSVALDPHKWLYAPLEVGCILVRDPDALMNAFSYRPDYYYFQADAKNFFERGIQNSRGFRALKVWMQLKHVGRAGYVRMISEDIQLARRFVEIADACDELEVFGTALSIATYRFVPSDLATRVSEPPVLAYLNELNEAIQGRMDLGGEAFVSNAVLGEVYALRMCVVNFRTTLEDVVALTEISERLGREADAEIRPDGLR
jgi:glutamate/tyrosine decarboxylase-like PLP-dependent enzyme